MNSVEAQAAAIARAVERYTQRFSMFSPGERVVVGCSGGADSTCLLHLLATGLPGLGLRCTAVYVDHGLRPGTEQEARWVEERARALGAEFVYAKVDVPGRVAESGGSVQEAARLLRYEALERVREHCGAARVAVGHTRSDQAETLLLQLLRGAGARGLSGIPPVRGRIVRPLLCVGRQETEAYCRAVGIPWMDDPSNDSAAYLRNRLRKELLPLLESYRPRIEERLAQAAEILREEDRYLEEQVAAALEGMLVPSELEGGVAVKSEALSRLPVAIARRAVRAIAARVSEQARGLSFDAVEAVLAFASGKEGGGRRLELGAIRVVQEYGELHFVKAFPPAGAESARAEPVEVEIPGRTPLPWAGAVLEASLHPAGGEGIPYRGAAAAVMDWEKLHPPLVVRSRRAGDRLQPAGMEGRKKVKDLLIDGKVPRRLRDRIPVVEDREGVVWVAGHALAERVRVTAQSRRLLRLQVRPLEGDEL